MTGVQTCALPIWVKSPGGVEIEPGCERIGLSLDPFVAAGKPVFQVEYQVGAGTVCPAANDANRNAILKSVDLFDVPWTPCR